MVIRYRNDNAIIIDSVAFNRKHSFNDSRLRASNIQLRTAESPDHAAERARITNYRIIILWRTSGFQSLTNQEDHSRVMQMQRRITGR